MERKERKWTCWKHLETSAGNTDNLKIWPASGTPWPAHESTAWSANYDWTSWAVLRKTGVNSTVDASTGFSSLTAKHCKTSIRHPLWISEILGDDRLLGFMAQVQSHQWYICKIPWFRLISVFMPCFVSFSANPVWAQTRTHGPWPAWLGLRLLEFLTEVLLDVVTRNQHHHHYDPSHPSRPSLFHRSWL